MSQISKKINPCSDFEGCLPLVHVIWHLNESILLSEVEALGIVQESMDFSGSGRKGW